MIVSHDKNNIDHVVYDIVRHIQTDVPLVTVTRLADYKFNHELKKLDRYILCNYSEFNWDFDWERGTPIFGKNIEQFRDKFEGDEWSRFIDFVNKKPPILTFQRELLAVDRTENILPIEFPNWHDAIPIDSKEQYDARPINVFNFWGRSHEDRVQLHGDIWKNATHRGYSVCDNIYHFNSFLANQEGEKWVSLYMPHYARVPIQEILKINGMSKLSVSLPGAGVKCFRSTGEAPNNSLICMPDDKLAWTYAWVDRFNCMKFENIYDVIHELLLPLIDGQNHKMGIDLYPIYCESVNTANKYNIKNYLKNYLEPTINKL